MKENQTPSKRILILGLPHFVAANDLHNPSVIFYDLATERRQNEIAEFVEILAQLDFSTICVEWRDQESLSQRYSNFLKTRIPGTQNELDQIVFRLAAKKNVSQIYACDFQLPMGEFDLPSQANFESWQRDFDKSVRAAYEKGLREVIQYLNSSESELSLVYLDILSNGNESAQNALLQWYIRNLNILRNVLKVQSQEPKLLFIGAGHVPFITGLAQTLGIAVKNVMNLPLAAPPGSP